MSDRRTTFRIGFNANLDELRRTNAELERMRRNLEDIERLGGSTPRPGD